MSPDGNGQPEASPAPADAAEPFLGLGTWEWDPRGGLLWWSESLYRIFGVNRANFQPNLAKVVAMTLVILGATAVALYGVMRPLFGVPVRGSSLLLFALTALFVVATAGMGIFAATLARNQAQVGMLTLLVVAPMLLLSGILTPIESMPAWVGRLMLLSPLRYFMEIAHGVLLKGSGLEVLWPQVLALTILGGGLFGFGLWRFRRQFQ